MSRHSTTVRQLADSSGIDREEALVTLWDAGFDEVDDIEDRIPKNKMALAQRALGVDSSREIRTLTYWCKALSVERDQLRSKLRAIGVDVSPNARVLPKGALAKMRKAGLGQQLEAAKQSGVAVTSGSATLANSINRLEPETEFEWRTVGPAYDCKYLTVAEVLKVHEILVRDFAESGDPISPPGVRDQGLLVSAVSRPTTNIGGIRKYSSAPLVAAALLHSLVHNHAFHNGNKRTALVAMVVLLDRNDRLLTCDQKALFKHVLHVAQHRIIPRHWSMQADREVVKIAEWINANSRVVEFGEQVITWRELRRVLARFDCALEGPLPGNKMKVRRTVIVKGKLGVSRSKRLTFTSWYGDDGREVRRNHLHDLRKKLHLDNDSGVDSALFYGTKGRMPDEVIAEYRNILKRLARL